MRPKVPRSPEANGPPGEPSADDAQGHGWRQLAPRLVALAEADREREACGLVVAGEGGALEAWPMPNGSPEPARAYLIPPQAMLGAMARLDREGRALAAVYHSHPGGGAGLSASDLDAALVQGEPLLPGVAQIVVALEAGRATRVRLHRFRDGRFQGEDLWPEPGRTG
jgi:proteasome lid subunit RPN8/RPN11